ncbi:hypothetical protein KIN20_028296 [Parelaphostrongylus tenuis]|uniref:Uncharacterized protein n=1 Tax=Parelaphostrongylus tenuis TaxID=148309 RepID=A0AAD5R1D8_PARTN|nr:hypothetical protein KIN20_028296 [Parelaphostrongylus tenuis]
MLEEETHKASSKEIEGKKDQVATHESLEERYMLEGVSHKASSEEIEGKKDQDATPESLKERHMLEWVSHKASSEEMEGKKDQDATPESLKERHMLEEVSHKASSEEIEGKKDQDATPESLEERYMLEGVCHKASSEEMEGKKDQDATPESLQERHMLVGVSHKAFGEEIEGRKDQDTTLASIEERKMLEREFYEASSAEGKRDHGTTPELIEERQLLGREILTTSSGEMEGEKDQDSTPESIEKGQILGREARAASGEEMESNLQGYEGAFAKHETLPSVKLSETPENHVEDVDYSDKLSSDPKQIQDEVYPSDHHHEVDDGLSRNASIMTQSRPSNEIPLEEESVDHEESILQTETVIRGDTQSFKLTHHEQLSGQFLTAKEEESTYGDLESQEDKFKKRSVLPDSTDLSESDDASTDSLVIHDTEHVTNVEHRMGDIPISARPESEPSISYLRNDGEEQAAGGTHSNKTSDSVHVLSSLGGSTQPYTSDSKFVETTEGDDLLLNRNIYGSYGNEQTNMEDLRWNQRL